VDNKNAPRDRVDTPDVEALQTQEVNDDDTPRIGISPPTAPAENNILPDQDTLPDTTPIMMNKKSVSSSKPHFRPQQNHDRSSNRSPVPPAVLASLRSHEALEDFGVSMATLGDFRTADEYGLIGIPAAPSHGTDGSPTRPKQQIINNQPPPSPQGSEKTSNSQTPPSPRSQFRKLKEMISLFETQDARPIVPPGESWQYSS